MSSLFAQHSDLKTNEVSFPGIVHHQKKEKDKRGSTHLRLFKLMLGRTLLNVLKDDKCTRLFNIQVQNENYMRKIINKKIVSLKVEEDQEMILTIAKKSYKNKFEQQFMINALKNIEFFENNSFMIEQQNKFCNIINSSSATKGTTLLDLGQPCSTFFILVKGLVYAMHPKLKNFKRKQTKTNSIVFQQQKTKVIDGSLQFEQPSLQRQESQPIQNSQGNSQNQIPSQTPKSKKAFYRQPSNNDIPLTIPAMFPNMDIVQTYQPGDTFGQVFLLSNSSSEMTLVCGENCEFLTISRQDYDELVGIQKDIVMRQKLEFLEQFDLFYNFTNVMLLQILELMQAQKYEKNGVIFRQGDESKFIYFIRQGEVKISFTYSNDSNNNKQVDKSPTQKQLDQSPQEYQKDKSKERFKNKKNQATVNEINEDKSENTTSTENKRYSIKDKEILEQLINSRKSGTTPMSTLAQFNSNLQRKFTKSLDIIILSNNTYFGEEDIISNKQFRNYTAICQSYTAEIFKIDALVKLFLLFGWLIKK